jgi:phosphoglycerate dehydrogenase-like enzyme
MNLLVVADQSLPELIFLEQLPKEINVIIENEADKIEKVASSVDILLLCNWSGNREILQKVLSLNSNIKWVHTWWTGVDSLVFPELANYPLTLTNAKGIYAEPLAEFVICACIYFAKNFPRMLNNQKQAHWEQFESELICGKTLGIFGYGEIGRSIAKKANALGMDVIAVRKRAELSEKDANLKGIIPFEEADSLFKTADFVVSSAPLTADTKHFIDKAKFDLMKSNAILINVGRGPVVKEVDLIDALKDRKIKGAALDVFEVEPLSKESPLWHMDNVLLSPHIADRNDGWLSNSINFFIQNCNKFVKGEELDNVVNLDLGY